MQLKTHQHFLNNKEKYIIQHENIEWWSRISINFFGAKFSVIKKYYTDYNINGKGIDEPFFSAICCLKYNQPNIIVPNFNIVHFSFGIQNAKNLVDSKYLLDYKILSENI